jgi:mono/diheme cytochrome c family protein
MSVAASLAGAEPCLLAVHGGARAADFSVCVDTASATAARDEALAQDVARRGGLALKLHHFDSNEDDDGLNAADLTKLLATQCDLMLGYPLEVTDPAPPAGLRVTSPYAQTGFVLVTAPPLPATGLADLPAGTEVAVTYGTMPNLYFVTHHNVQADVQLSEAATLKALVAGEVKAAMVSQPTVTQYLASHAGAALRFAPLQEPHARWNIVGLYGPNGDAAAAAFQAQMAGRKQSGQLETHTRFGFRNRPASGLPFVQLAAAVSGGLPDPAVPALFTTAQATAGAAKYSDDCAQCHGAQLEGMAGPALRGKIFAKSGFSVGDVMNFMSVNMPATQPGSLSHDDYVQIMAYVLQQNGFPAGTTALTFDGGAASKVPLLYHGN